MDLPWTIPQYADRPESWERFLYKASTGSYKAVNIMQSARFAIVAHIEGESCIETASGEAFDQALMRTVPIISLQEWLDILYRSGHLDIPMTARTQPFHARSYYQALWRRHIAVSSHRLLHDAAFYCSLAQQQEELTHLCNRVSEEYSDYNSQDVVAAMLFLLAVFAQHKTD
jgi:hypothetical protein